MNKVLRKITINNMQINDRVKWLNNGLTLTIKKFAPCSEIWCNETGQSNHYRECEKVRVLITNGTSDYVMCCKQIEVVRPEVPSEL